MSKESNAAVQNALAGFRIRADAKNSARAAKRPSVEIHKVHEAVRQLSSAIAYSDLGTEICPEAREHIQKTWMHIFAALYEQQSYEKTAARVSSTENVTPQLAL